MLVQNTHTVYLHAVALAGAPAVKHNAEHVLWHQDMRYGVMP